MKNQIVTAVCLVTALGLAAPAFAEDPPRRRPGLWETTMNSAQMPGPALVSRQCIDEKTDNSLLKSAANGKESTCTESAMKRLANGGWEVDSVCKTADGTLTSHATITGDFSSQFSMELKGKWTPPRDGMSDTQTRIIARHLGACPADMKPGDMKVNGMLIRAGGMPANMSPKQTEQMNEQMKKMMEQMQRQQQK